MKLIFLGTPEFARVSLFRLLSSRHQILAVVTLPDKPQGRGLKLRPSPVKQLAVELGLPVLQPESLKDESFLIQLRSMQADAFVVVAFRILPPEVFNIPPKGTINLHASLLPKYRGAAPINWALINGEKETGVTTILINEHVDQGNILLQEKIPITPEMNAGELHDKLAFLGAEVLLKTLDGIEKGTLKPRPQDDTQATKAPKISKEICHLNFNQPALKVHNWVRGLSPYPGAYCLWQGKMLKILRSAPATIRVDSNKHGSVIQVMKNCFTVACAEGALDVFEVQLPGKKVMPVAAFLNGYELKVGDLLT